MHLVTKILIVFGALLSVLLAGLTMAYTHNAQAIKDSVANEKATAAAAIASLNEERTKWSTENAREKSSGEAARNELATIKNEIARLSNERAKVLADLEDAKRDAARAGADSKGKDERLATLTQLVAALQSESSEARKSQVDAARRETEYMARITDLDSQNQVYSQNVKALQEQLAEMKLSMTKATAPAASSGTTATGTLPSTMGAELAVGPLVTARVRKTVRADSGEDLAFITAGSSAGLKVGQRMHVVRDGRFVASLVLTAVDATEAAGRIDRLGRSIDVLTDDLVLSRVN